MINLWDEVVLKADHNWYRGRVIHIEPSTSKVAQYFLVETPHGIFDRQEAELRKVEIPAHVHSELLLDSGRRKGRPRTVQAPEEAENG